MSHTHTHTQQQQHEQAARFIAEQAASSPWRGTHTGHCDQPATPSMASARRTTVGHVAARVAADATFPSS